MNNFFLADEAPRSTASSEYAYLLSLFLIGKLAITAAAQLIWVYSLEILPTEFRSVVAGEASVFGRVGSIFSPYIIDLLVIQFFTTLLMSYNSNGYLLFSIESKLSKTILLKIWKERVSPIQKE